MPYQDTGGVSANIGGDNTLPVLLALIQMMQSREETAARMGLEERQLGLQRDISEFQKKQEEERQREVMRQSFNQALESDVLPEFRSRVSKKKESLRKDFLKRETSGSETFYSRLGSELLRKRKLLGREERGLQEFIPGRFSTDLESLLADTTDPFQQRGIASQAEKELTSLLNDPGVSDRDRELIADALQRFQPVFQHYKMYDPRAEIETQVDTLAAEALKKANLQGISFEYGEGKRSRSEALARAREAIQQPIETGDLLSVATLPRTLTRPVPTVEEEPVVPGIFREASEIPGELSRKYMGTSPSDVMTRFLTNPFGIGGLLPSGFSGEEFSAPVVKIQSTPTPEFSPEEIQRFMEEENRRMSNPYQQIWMGPIPGEFGYQMTEQPPPVPMEATFEGPPGPPGYWFRRR